MLAASPVRPYPSSAPNSIITVNSFVKFLAKISGKDPQVTCAYFVDSKEAQKKLEVTITHDHNELLMARLPHPEFECPTLTVFGRVGRTVAGWPTLAAVARVLQSTIGNAVVYTGEASGNQS